MSTIVTNAASSEVGPPYRVRPPLGDFLPRADPLLYQSSRYWSSKEPYSNSGHKVAAATCTQQVTRPKGIPPQALGLP